MICESHVDNATAYGVEFLPASTTIASQADREHGFAGSWVANMENENNFPKLRHGNYALRRM